MLHPDNVLTPEQQRRALEATAAARGVTVEDMLLQELADQERRRAWGRG